jgi:hypothetical protein
VDQPEPDPRKGRKMDTMENTWDKFQNELQKAPKKVGCLVCGFRSEDVEEIEDFQENGCPECKAFDYEGTIRFTTDKKLTNEQLNQLMDIIALQIIEPVDADQNDEDYSTRGVEVIVKEVE